MQILYTNIKDLILDKNLLPEYLPILSSAEQRRFESTKLQKNKIQFLIGRVLLRVCLAEKLNCSTKKLEFQSNENGRLRLDFPQNDIHFSLSHSEDLVLLVLSDGATCNQLVGADLEYMKERQFLKIAKFFFSVEEFDFLTNNFSKENFYALWTLKESFIKCLGGRLFSSEDRLAFNLNTNQKNIITNRDSAYRFDSYLLNEDYIFSIASSRQNIFQERDWHIFQITQILPIVAKQLQTKSTLLYSS